MFVKENPDRKKRSSRLVEYDIIKEFSLLICLSENSAKRWKLAVTVTDFEHEKKTKIAH